MSPLYNDTDDDVTLQNRRSAAEDQGYSQRRSEVDDDRPVDREVTLNTGIVLVLFFALALLCAVFFGFGYSMGRKSVPPPVAAELDTTTPAVSSAASPKPAPGSPASAPVPDYVPSAGTPAERPAAPVVRTPPASSTAAPALPLSRAAATAADSTVVTRPAPVVRVPAATVPPAAAPATTSSAAVPGTSYVQIAAVSHQEDADVLLSALRRRGYVVLTRTDPTDHLIHVQVGPFSNRKEADAMRLKLAGDGYNAFIK